VYKTWFFSSNFEKTILDSAGFNHGDGKPNGQPMTGLAGWKDKEVL
jgi:hypothetical protein